MTPRAGRGLLSLVAVSPEIKPTRPGSSWEYTGVRSICAGRAVIRLLGLPGRPQRRPRVGPYSEAAACSPLSLSGLALMSSHSISLSTEIAAPGGRGGRPTCSFTLRHRLQAWSVKPWNFHTLTGCATTARCVSSLVVTVAITTIAFY